MCICRFHFELVYGKRGEGLIEIHHTKPLSSKTDEMIIDPKNDLIPVCSNCHKMIHRRQSNLLKVADVKRLVSNKRIGWVNKSMGSDELTTYKREFGLFVV